MMGLGSLKSGGAASSSSNLSALAPPFTVDRSNPRPNLNSPVHFTESPYASHFSQNWVYPQSLASRPGFCPSGDLEIDSLRTTCLPSANDYQYSASDSKNPSSAPRCTLNPGDKIATDSFPYVVESKPYYPPYVSPMVNDDTPLLALNEPAYDLLSSSGLALMDGSSSQVDYTQSLSGLEYTPHWGGFWNGLANEKWGKETGLEGSFCTVETNPAGSFVYKNHMNQGACTTESLIKCKENYTVGDGTRISLNGRDNHTGALRTGQLDDKTTLVQNLRFTPVESSRAPTLGTVSIYSDYLQAPSLESASNSWNHQKSSSSHEKCFHPLDSNVNDCISVTKSSHSLVVAPPASDTTTSPSNVVSSITADICSAEAVKADNFDGSKGKEPHLPQVSQGGGLLDASQVSLHIDRNDHHIFVSPFSTKEEWTNKLLSKDALDGTFKSRSRFQVPDINVPDDVSFNLEAVWSAENSSNSLDHHNPAVDSPCWKGAPASKFGPFEVSDAAVTPVPIMKKLETFNGFNLQEAQTSMETFFPESVDKSVNDESRFVESDLLLSPERSSLADFTAKEDGSDDAAKSDCPKLSCNKGVQFSDGIEKPRKYDLSSESKTVSTSKALHNEQPCIEENNSSSETMLKQASVAEAGMNTNNGGCCVPFYAMENTSRSLSLGEHAAKHLKLLGKESIPDMNIRLLVNAMHNLSELLLFYCSNDAHALNEQYHGVVKHVIGNLEACMPKKIAHMTPIQKSTFPLRGNSYKYGESSDIHVGGSAGSLHVRNDTAGNSSGQINCQAEQRNYNDSDFISSRTDAAVLREDKMVQAIKRILDENFHGNEESQSQSLLYKNLWLEAEAELCSIGFRARFDRKRVEMENLKSDKAKENTAALEEPSSSDVSPVSNLNEMLINEARGSSIPSTSVLDFYISNSSGHVDDAEASVMARFDVLKRRGDNSNPMNEEEQQLAMADDTGFTRERNLLRFMENQLKDTSLDVVLGHNVPHPHGNGNENKVGSNVDGLEEETLREFGVNVTNDPVIQHCGNNRRPWSQLHSGWYDNSSSDWEHVPKNEFAWQ